jgi:acetyl/propionyl-CoA carboxylase alpha subunit
VKERYVVETGGRRRLVEIREVGDEYEISIDGEAHRVDACRIPATSVTSLIVEGRSWEIGTVQDGDRIDVYVDGEIHPVMVWDEIWARAVEAHAGPSGSEEVHAPIPGSVVRVLVAEGDQVPAGAAVVVLEAMKMQNELLSRNGGVVSRVHVAEGDTVAAGQRLVVLLPAGAAVAAE